jgi:hypothetical protein
LHAGDTHPFAGEKYTAATGAEWSILPLAADWSTANLKGETGVPTRDWSKSNTGTHVAARCSLGAEPEVEAAAAGETERRQAAKEEEE